MKDKNVAGILAFFLGFAGVHRFYLGQTGLGIFYFILMFSGISVLLGMLDAIIFLTMDKEKFDLKYNRKHLDILYRDEDRGSKKRHYEHRRYDTRRHHKRQREIVVPPRKKAKKANPYKISGIKKFKDYDYSGAIKDFEKALKIDEKDVAIHWNLACAYSLNEDLKNSLVHLDMAVANGFDDFERIKTHDALAFIRIQEEFEEFEKNDFRLMKAIEKPKENILDKKPDLLDQLNKLNALRKKGLLTEEEFKIEKEKLIRK